MKLDNNQYEKLLDLLQSKVSISEIAKMWNIPYMQLYYFINRTPELKQFSSVKNNGKSKTTLNARAKSRVKLDEHLIVELYCNQHISSAQIAKQFNTTNVTILSRLRELGVNINLTNGKTTYVPPIHPKDILEELYISKQLSMMEIKELLQYDNHGHVQQDLLKHGIKPRTYKEAGALLYIKRPEKRELHRIQAYERINAGKWGTQRITDIEQLFMDWANRNNIPFVYQFQIHTFYHRYDFHIIDTGVIVEMDGIFWHKDHAVRDATFDLYAERSGYRVFRITNIEVKQNPNIFDELILPVITTKRGEWHANT